MDDIIKLLKETDIQPTSQRIVVADYVLKTEKHPSAEDVLEAVKGVSPALSRATVYNTLNLFVEKGLLVTQVLKEGKVVFDPNVEPHHHFIDEVTGQIVDIPYDQLEVKGVEALEGVDVKHCQVVIRGRKK